MLTVVISVKKMTQSVAVARPDIHHGLRPAFVTKAGQGTWKCGLTAEFIDAEQMSVQELMALRRMHHTTLDDNHQNWSIHLVGVVKQLTRPGHYEKEQIDFETW